MQISISTNMKERNLGVPKLVRNLLKKYNASLILPGEQTPVLGPELVLNGDFSNGTTGWVAQQATLSTQGGELVVTTTASNYGIGSQSVTLPAGSAFIVTGRLRKGTAETSAAIAVWDGATQTTQATNTSGASQTTTAVYTAKGSGVVQIKLTAYCTSTGVTAYFDNISVREILSYSDAINGFRTGNWTDSVGSIPATIDGKTGLVVDAAGSVGPELVTNGGFSNGLAGWIAAIGGTSLGSLSSGGVLIERSADSVINTGIATETTSASVGKFYRVEFDVLSSSGNILICETLTTTLPVGRFSRVIQSINNRPFSIRCYAAASATIDNISVRELTGTHAMQATDGYKPVERRGLVNLLTYSNDFSNAVWSKTSCSYSGGRLIEDSTSLGRNIRQPYTFAVGEKYSVAARVKPDQRNIVYVASYDGVKDYGVSFNLTTGQFSGIRTSANAIAPSGYSIAPDTDGYYIIVMNFTSQGVGGIYAAQVGLLNASGDWPSTAYQGDGTSGIYLHSAALFQGTVTAQQIIDAGGIPVTTDAPKSSALGPRYWQFDGVDDRLQLSSVPFQMSDDHWVVVATRKTPNNTNQFIACPACDSAIPLSRIAGVTANPQGFVVGWYDGTNYNKADIPANAFENIVLSGKKSGSTGYVRKNGVQVGIFPITVTLTANSGAVGAHGSGTSFYSGDNYCVIYGKGAITDAELLLLEKFAGKLAGVQI